MDDKRIIFIGKKKFTAKQLKAYRITFIILGWLIAVISIFSIPFLLIIALFLLLMAHTYNKLLKNPPEVATPPAPCVPASSIPIRSDKKIESCKVAGTSFRTDNIMELASENPDYDMSKKEIIECGMDNEKIFRFDFSPCKTELVEEPDNEYDPNAVKVIIDCIHVGYIKKGSCSHIKKLLHSSNSMKISSEIFGGDYKIVYCDESEDGRESSRVKKDHCEFSIKLTLEY